MTPHSFPEQTERAAELEPYNKPTFWKTAVEKGGVYENDLYSRTLKTHVQKRGVPFGSIHFESEDFKSINITLFLQH